MEYGKAKASGNFTKKLTLHFRGMRQLLNMQKKEKKLSLVHHSA